MSAEGGTKSILAAMGANLGIAVTKFVAFLLSGASSMLAESVHSAADTVNQILLLVGGRKSKKAADLEHPFGHGRERYVYAFVVSIILFSIGGVFAVYEGVEKIENPHPLNNWWIPVLVIVISIALEGFSFRTALGEARHGSKHTSILKYIHRAKAPEIPVVLLEDSAALIGLVFALFGIGLTTITHNGIWDGIATVCIGVLLVLVAIVLAIETKSLLVGEGATPEAIANIRDAIHTVPMVSDIIHMRTLYLGPDELLVALKVGVPDAATAHAVADAIDEVEVAIRSAVPETCLIYVEPDVRHSTTA